MVRWLAAVAGLVVTVGVVGPEAEAQMPAGFNPADDSAYQWLEEVEGQPQLDWVRARNASSQAALEALPGFASFRDRGLEILNDRRRIAYPNVQNDRVTNFWQDAGNVRGLWRTASLTSYIAGKPQWETLLDLDALSKSEGKNWVWKGANCLQPDYTRCLVSLSNGGKDAVEIREFDMASRSFVADGFRVPEAKTWLAWYDADTLMIGTDFGPGSLTTSGYPRMVKLWDRGTPLAKAKTIFEGKVEDVWAMSSSALTRTSNHRMISRGLTFWTGELYHVAADHRLVRSPLPIDADVRGVTRGHVVALMRTDWTHEGKTYPKGSLVAYQIDPLLAGQAPVIEQVYVPPRGVAVEGVAAAKDALYVSILDNVKGHLLRLSEGPEGSWTPTREALPANVTVQLISTGDLDDRAFINIEGFTSPDQLLIVGPGSKPRVVASAPQRFDPAKFTVTQRFTLSKDGTRVPYFVVRPKDAKGPLPTLLYAYGGFEVSITPSYVSPMTQFWLEEGNQYVVANIRGGGEFGPAWHQAGLKANRQRIYDDFHAVAQDLIDTGQTGPKQLGIFGGSNGGLLVGVAYTQRPDLYTAVMMGVPLADMRRYHLLLAGASWMAEYGNPDDPAEWAFISRYSPFQNIRPGQPYPRVFFFTSTKDDRVHPAHARKMAARMEAYGYPFFYYENIDGGHAGVANLKETAYRSAIMLTYLNRELRGLGKE
jgi:prolyl oligopeptidase